MTGVQTCALPICLSCRVKVLLCIFVFGCSFLRLEPTLSAEVVTIRPGPSGGLSIKDGSGELIVIPIGGGNYWIGSSSDYDRGRVNGFAIEHGFRPAIVAGKDPGKPTQNAQIESLNGRICNEFLNAHSFSNIYSARQLAALWRDDYNETRSHSSLGYLTPKAFAEAHENKPPSQLSVA